MSLLHAHERIGLDLADDGDGERTGARPRLRRIDARLRVGATVLFALAVVALGHLPAAGLALAIAVAAAVAAGLALRPVLQKLLALDGFMVLALASLPFTLPGEPLFSVVGFAATQEGLARALLILLKANAVLLMVLALVGTLGAVRLGQALRGLGLPEKLVQLHLFTVRYLDVLAREYRRLRLAMRARAFRLRCDRHSWRTIGYLFGMLMVRSVERAERILCAMRARGFDGRFPSLDEPTPLKGADGGFAALAVMGIAFLLFLEAV